MRVAIDATTLGSGLGGDETMLAGLLRGLAVAAEPGDVFPVITAASASSLPADVRGDASFPVHAIARGGGVDHFVRRLPRVLGHDIDPEPDLVFAVTHGPFRTTIPVALMVQDLSFIHHPDHYPVTTRVRLQQLVPRQARRAAAVFTVSEFSRRDLVHTLDLDPARVFHIPNTVDAPLALPADEIDRGRDRLRGLGVDGPFFLYLGNRHRRKNLAGALVAFERARRSDPALASHRFVVAGARWWGSGRAPDEEAPRDDGSVVFLGRVDDVTREILLRDAVALVYVSLFEGFGLPPLEAMVRGTPVLASNVTSIPEVTGDAALLVDPDDPDEIAEAMVRIAVDDDVRRSLVAKGRARGAHYSVETTGRAARAAFGTAIGEQVVSR